MIKKNLTLILFVFSLFLFNVSSQEYGLVLAGGGGKGAYQVGVWKALTEYGFAQKVTAISGTSVGGLNGGIFACEEIEKIEDVWTNEVPWELYDNTLELIDEEGLSRIIDKVNLSFFNKKYSYPKVYVTTARKRFWPVKFILKILDVEFPHRFLLNTEPDILEIKKMLLATSAFPVVTKAVLLKDGYYHVDGGLSDNVPISPLLDKYRNGKLEQIFVIYLDHSPSRLLSKDYPDVSILEIIPSEELGGLFEGTTNFSRSKINHLIQLGYDDTVKILKENNLYPVSRFWFKDTHNSTMVVK